MPRLLPSDLSRFALKAKISQQVHQQTRYRKGLSSRLNKKKMTIIRAYKYKQTPSNRLKPKILINATKISQPTIRSTFKKIELNIKEINTIIMQFNKLTCKQKLSIDIYML